MKILGKMQKRATIWILGAFKTSPLYGIEAIAGLIPINLHLQKLGGRSQLQANKLPPSYLLHLLIDSQLNCYSTVCYGTNSRVRVRIVNIIGVIISLQRTERDRK